MSTNITEIAEVLTKLKPSPPKPSDVSKALKKVKDEIVRKTRSITDDGRPVQKVFKYVA